VSGLEADQVVQEPVVAVVVVLVEAAMSRVGLTLPSPVILSWLVLVALDQAVLGKMEPLLVSDHSVLQLEDRAEEQVVVLVVLDWLRLVEIQQAA
jgi:hypothetical protein